MTDITGSRDLIPVGQLKLVLSEVLLRDKQLLSLDFGISCRSSADHAAE